MIRTAGCALLGFAAVLAVLVLCAGCVRRADGNQSQASETPSAVAVYHDYGTGCEYVSADSAHSALTPRIAADGKTHMGCKGGAR